jgi:hypothetical protein
MDIPDKIRDDDERRSRLQRVVQERIEGLEREIPDALNEVRKLNSLEEIRPLFKLGDKGR